MRVELPVMLKCAGCGISFELSARNVRRHRRLGLQHFCRTCPTRFSMADVERAKRWWLKNYSLEELQSWPPL
jgi:ribosomal protein L33